jgi:hypothetical protein
VVVSTAPPAPASASTPEFDIPAVVVSPNGVTVESANASSAPAAASGSPSASHDDSVSKALDLFDPNAK